MKLATYKMDLGVFAVNPKRTFRHFKKIVGQNNVVIYGHLTSGKTLLSKELTNVYIEWHAGREPMIKFGEVGKANLHAVLDDAYYYTHYQIAKFLELVRSHNKRFVLVFINEMQFQKYASLLENYDYIMVDTGEKMISEADRAGWLNSRIKPPFITLDL